MANGQQRITEDKGWYDGLEGVDVGTRYRGVVHWAQYMRGYQQGVAKRNRDPQAAATEVTVYKQIEQAYRDALKARRRAPELRMES